MATSTTPIQTIAFSGSSKFSSDFQQVLTRAVAIASMPLQGMQATQSTLSDQQNALGGLQNTFNSLQSALGTIGSAAQGNPLADVSDPTVLQAATSPGALDGTYTIEVTGLGSYTTTLSKAGLTTVTDATAGNISNASSYTLTINGTDHTISSSGGSLESLATAINNTGLGVAATIVNIGSTSSPDYRLAITSQNLGGDTIDLKAGTTDLLDTLSTGTLATYKVSGLSTEIQSTSRQITLAPGLTVNLLKAAPGQAVSISVLHDFSSLKNGLSGLATAYNAAVDALNQQRGKGAGPLAGQSLIFSLQGALRSLSQYSNGAGSVGSIADLGLTLNQSGHLTFDQGAFNSGNTTAIQQFLGDASSGFIKAANDSISAVADPVSGAIEADVTTVQGQITRTNDQISQEQTRISDLQASLQQSLSAADAAIAVLQQQATMMADLFAAMHPNPTSSAGS